MNPFPGVLSKAHPLDDMLPDRVKTVATSNGTEVPPSGCGTEEKPCRNIFQVCVCSWIWKGESLLCWILFYYVKYYITNHTRLWTPASSAWSMCVTPPSGMQRLQSLALIAQREMHHGLCRILAVTVSSIFLLSDPVKMYATPAVCRHLMPS